MEIFIAANSIAGELHSKVWRYGCQIPQVAIHIEAPVPSGSYSAGLWALDTLIVGQLKELGEIETSLPSWIGHLHGTRKWAKSLSVTLAEKCIKVLVANGFKDRRVGRLSHDASEALLYAVTTFCRETNTEIRGQLLALAPFIKE